jgi:predicted nucleic acid-binding protein
MKKVLLDTDTLSEILKAKNPTIAKNAHVYRTEHGRYTFSAVTVMEVIRGLFQKRYDSQIAQFVKVADRNEVLSLDRTSGELAGRIYADLARHGTPIGIADIMIAAIAIHRGLPLATGNASDYIRVQQVGYPLALEDWREPIP